MVYLSFTFSPEPAEHVQALGGYAVPRRYPTIEAATYRNRSGHLMAKWANPFGRTFVYRLRPDGTFGRGDTKVYGTYTDEIVTR